MTWPAGTERILREAVDSTMAEALRVTATPPFWVMAHRQTAARGRRGRAWLMPEGNFAATVALPAPGTAEARAQRAFVASLALRDAMLGLVAADRLALKWPNDVLLDGRKVAGILLENQPGPLLIGFGVNLAAAPEAEALEAEAVAPAHLDGVCGAEAFLDRLAPAMAEWEAVFVAEGFGPVRATWLEGAARLGEIITARLPRQSFTGRFATVDGGGALVLDTPTGRRHLAAAEIHFPDR